MDSQRIMLKIRELEHYCDELQELIPSSKEEYLKSLRIRRAIERQLQIMIECVIDISFLVIKNLHLNVPTDEDSLFDLLKSYITNPLKMKEMKGFRNLLVHRYGNVDDSKVYQFLTTEIEDFQIFINDVKKTLKNSNLLP
jgi:uncharacterized protein YutE (UPF0331/DUF86 family)